MKKALSISLVLSFAVSATAFSYQDLEGTKLKPNKPNVFNFKQQAVAAPAPKSSSLISKNNPFKNYVEISDTVSNTTPTTSTSSRVVSSANTKMLPDPKESDVAIMPSLSKAEKKKTAKKTTKKSAPVKKAVAKAPVKKAVEKSYIATKTKTESEKLKEEVALLKKQLAEKDSKQTPAKQKTTRVAVINNMKGELSNKEPFESATPKKHTENPFKDYTNYDPNLDVASNDKPAKSNTAQAKSETKNPFRDYTSEENQVASNEKSYIEKGYNDDLDLAFERILSSKEDISTEDFAEDTKSTFYQKVPSYKNAYIQDNLDSNLDLKEDLQETYYSQNRYIAPIESYREEELDREIEQRKAGFSSTNLSKKILQIKINFANNSSALNSANINNIRRFADIVKSSPSQGIRVSIGEDVYKNPNEKVLASKRFSIISKVLQEEGLSQDQIIPVITTRDKNSIALNITNIDVYKEKIVSDGKDIFGNAVNIKKYNIMNW